MLYRYSHNHSFQEELTKVTPLLGRMRTVEPHSYPEIPYLRKGENAKSRNPETFREIRICAVR